jgi:alkylation response protein AidB-like acyl-CoA dehydrogenase
VDLGCHYSDFGIVLVRTNPDVPKHKGMTMFWLNMKSRGIEVRPIHQMSGGRDFNEVYFTDVRIKGSQRLGSVDDGWRVALVSRRGGSPVQSVTASTTAPGAAVRDTPAPRLSLILGLIPPGKKIRQVC